MNELEKAPEWLAEAFPGKVEYFGCTGAYTNEKTHKKWWRFNRQSEPSQPPDLGWTLMFYSAEDAEANAAPNRFTPNEYGWIWDGEPAQAFSLSDVLRAARADGRKGVVIWSFTGGKWVNVHSYPADQPLPEALR